MDIHEIHFIHKPTSDFIFPQDIFFKKLHSNKEYPLIMYKQDKNLEPAFRLYTPFLDLKGKQKPFFENKKLLKLCSQLKHKENLGLYVYKKDVEIGRATSIVWSPKHSKYVGFIIAPKNIMNNLNDYYILFK